MKGSGFLKTDVNLKKNKIGGHLIIQGISSEDLGWPILM